MRVYNADGSERFGFLAYDAGYTGGVSVATGDVTGDGVDDVVTGTLGGGAPHVKVFDGATGVELSGFMAFDPAFQGGVSVAVGDVNGDGFADIAVGARAGGGPHVKVFSGLDGSELMSFFAYDMGFKGGVSVAVAGGEVVTGALAGGAPHVKVFAGMTGEVTRSFLAFDASHGGGVNVAGGDLTGDGVVDYLVGQASGGAMMMLDGATGGTQARTPFDGFRGGVGVAVKDLDDDGTAEMLTSAAAVGGHLTPGRGRTGAIAPIPGAPRVRGLNLNGDGYFDFFAFDPAFPGGVSVG